MNPCPLFLWHITTPQSTHPTQHSTLHSSQHSSASPLTTTVRIYPKRNGKELKRGLCDRWLDGWDSLTSLLHKASIQHSLHRLQWPRHRLESTPKLSNGSLVCWGTSWQAPFSSIHDSWHNHRERSSFESAKCHWVRGSHKIGNQRATTRIFTVPSLCHITNAEILKSPIFP